MAFCPNLLTTARLSDPLDPVGVVATIAMINIIWDASDYCILQTAKLQPGTQWLDRGRVCHCCPVYKDAQPGAQPVVATVDVPDNCHHLPVVQDMIDSEVRGSFGHERIDEQLAVAARSQPCVTWRHDVRKLLVTSQLAGHAFHELREAHIPSSPLRIRSMNVEWL